MKRIILKLSGEALSGGKGYGFDDEMVGKICQAIKEVHEKDIEIAIVVGGGNFWRGRSATEINRATSDTMGMLGTIINGLRLQAELESIGVDTRLQTAIHMPEVAEAYIRRRAVRHLEKGRIVIFAAGTGLPYFSTDTTAALRAAEIDADTILAGKTGTDGVYDKDPNVYDDAVKFEELSYMEVLNRGLEVMDLTAITFCQDNNIELLVFGIDDTENLIRASNGEKLGTIIKEIN